MYYQLAALPSLLKHISVLLTILIIGLSNPLDAQQQIPLDEQALREWKTISNVSISHEGNNIVYQIDPNQGDPQINIYDVDKKEEFIIPRATHPHIDNLSGRVISQVHPSQRYVDSLRLKGKKDEELPPDTLSIFNLTTGENIKYPNVKKVHYPDNWEGKLFATTNHLKKKKNEESQHTLLIIDLSKGHADTITSVTDFDIATDSQAIAVLRHTSDSAGHQEILIIDLNKNEMTSIFSSEGIIEALSIADDGNAIAFIHDDKASHKDQAQFELLYYHRKSNTTTNLSQNHQLLTMENWHIPAHSEIEICNLNNKIYYKICPIPTKKDTTILLSERPDVEVWHYDDNVLYTQQKVNKKKDEKKTYLQVFDLASKKCISIENEHITSSFIHPDSILEYSFGVDEYAYRKVSSWEGRIYKDLYLINNTTGEKKLIQKKTSGKPKWSPAGKYIYWYEEVDTCWYAYSLALKERINITKQDPIFCDELNDLPDYPESYGLAGWTYKDAEIILYDRYDLWSFSLKNTSSNQRLTRGRENTTIYRHIKLDPDAKVLSDDRWLLRGINELDKSEFYGLYAHSDQTIDTLTHGDFALSHSPIKAKNTDAFLYTRESFNQFPDLIYSPDLSLTASEKISNVNPQQKKYAWGHIELFSWEVNGKRTQGLLAKPANFDPGKKYPMIVNFYDRSSEHLHRHPTPFPHRSTINYAYYTSQGYVIFNPDVFYTIGYPGKSALDAVVSGTKAVIQKGYVDPTKVGLQGHSWGGYQIAYILTKTDMFACAEAGAPVVNMVSAYGGIRWQTGLSRMFQYEHTQSRLGATLWERPDLYLENSPIFELDKVATPVLIMHNDKDGHVPWYQGIEYFVAMRRLGKPAWMLNYNGEPHWPLKWANRLDFNRRLFQFFEHYLKDTPMPEWMTRGIPEIEKGKNSGLSTGTSDR